MRRWTPRDERTSYPQDSRRAQRRCGRRTADRARCRRITDRLRIDGGGSMACEPSRQANRGPPKRKPALAGRRWCRCLGVEETDGTEVTHLPAPSAGYAERLFGLGRCNLVMIGRDARLRLWLRRPDGGLIWCHRVGGLDHDHGVRHQAIFRLLQLQIGLM